MENTFDVSKFKFKKILHLLVRLGTMYFSARYKTCITFMPLKLTSLVYRKRRNSSIPSYSQSGRLTWSCSASSPQNIALKTGLFAANSNLWAGIILPSTRNFTSLKQVLLKKALNIVTAAMMGGKGRSVEEKERERTAKTLRTAISDKTKPSENRCVTKVTIVSFDW